jgi:hypothetical protein
MFADTKYLNLINLSFRRIQARASNRDKKFFFYEGLATTTNLGLSSARVGKMVKCNKLLRARQSRT